MSRCRAASETLKKAFSAATGWFKARCEPRLERAEGHVQCRD